MMSTVALSPPEVFPALRRAALEVLQVNLGYRCNQQCRHCHVAAGPARREMMSRQGILEVLAFLERSRVKVLDLTGGAPELNPHFRELVGAARGLGVHVMDRCNLTVLEEPGQEGTVEFLASHGVEVVASLPCYLEENVDRQRGDGVFVRSMRGLARLNRLGYGVEGSGLVLNLVYNPAGPALPPSQCRLEAAYKERLGGMGIVFNHLFTLANMPIHRFGVVLEKGGERNSYLDLLRHAFQPVNLATVMCRTLLNVDWRGRLYDCDFNQALGLPLCREDGAPFALAELEGGDTRDWSIRVGEHCFGCTAGQGSSCGGALVQG